MEEEKGNQPDDQANDGGPAATAVDPDGFFPVLDNSDACAVNVAIRVRPLVGRELSSGNKKVCISSPVIPEPNPTKMTMSGKAFDFDAVFWDGVAQEHIFNKCARNLVLGCFHGYNATILAYGQTGSGKTHTMGTGNTIGVPFDEVGIVPRVFKFVFDELDVRRAQSEFSEFKVRIAFLELYNEELHDLLDPASMVRDRATGKPLKELTIREEKNVISVRGLKELEVTTQAECLHWLNSGINHRQTSATLMNEGSSRSHAIFTVTIEQKIIKEMEEGVADAAPEGEEKAQVTEEISAKFHFVDLAGSERIKKTGATGQLLKEGISINKGLLCLGQVISALTESKKGSGHIPYRDSKLTRILQDSLGGNSRTTMIACVSPAESNYEESLGTVKYASRARNIKNKPVVNRDANSLLIEALKTTITQLQGEVAEYVAFVQGSGLSLPQDLGQKAKLAIAAKQEAAPPKPKAVSAPSAASGGGANPAEVRELKIKLSQRDRELRELQQKLKDQQIIIDQRDKTIKEIEKEKDNITLKSESMAEKLKTNNIEFDGKDFEAKPGQGVSAEASQKSGLIDQYKLKLSKAQKDLDSKVKDIQTLNQKYLAIKGAQDRNDKILKKHVDENQQLKKQLASGGGARAASAGVQPRAAAPAAAGRDFKTMRAERKAAASRQLEELETKVLADLEGQIDLMFTKRGFNPDEGLKGALDTTAASDVSVDASIATSEGADKSADESQVPAEKQSDEATAQSMVEYDKEALEKEKVLRAVKQQALTMSTDIKDLLKNEWAGIIKSIEGEKEQAETDHKKNLSSAKNDQKAVQALENEHKKKIEALNRQMAKQEAEKNKKQESVAKQVALQEARIKALEADVQKKKIQKEELEKAKKLDENRFFKFKQDIGKDLHSEKKKISDKEKELAKVRTDLKKVDQLAQQKIAQLKGLQKRALEEKARKAALEEKEYSGKGLDLDVIKAWIQFNTDAMLKNQELKEYLEKQSDEKDKIENEMLEEGDRMTDVLIHREKLLAEKEELDAQAEGERDEGRVLELEDELKDLGLEIHSITETLDLLEGTLEFVSHRYNQVLEEIEAFDMDSVQPMSFNALDSIDSARATLKTFFQVVLDLNIYKRDIEAKCIEQDEQVIRLTAQANTQEARIQYMILNGNQDGYAATVAKQQAINTVMRQVDGYVDNRDVEHLNLNKEEQTNLTKLSLSKIVNNLKKKLQEQEVKTQQVSLKLDQALKQKEIYRSRVDELKAQQKAASYGGASSSRFNQAKVERKEPVPAPAAERSRGLSFRDRQRQKAGEDVKPQAPPRKVESLADRRKNRGHLIETEQIDSNDALNKLKAQSDKMDRDKQNAQGGLLDEIAEEDLPEGDLEDEDDGMTRRPLGGGSAFLGYADGDTTMEHNTSTAQFEITEDWVQETFVTLYTDAKLVDFFFLNSKMLCIFEDFQVQELDLDTRLVAKSYNLQEIEGFEISEEAEEDKVVAFALEKDVQLLGVVCVDAVHIFEYSEDTENSLSHVTCVSQPDVIQIVFVDYHIVMEKRVKDQDLVELLCYDPDGASVKGQLQVPVTGTRNLVIEPGSECIYVAAGTHLSKILVPSMAEVYKADTKHQQDVIEIAVSQMNQIVTTSNDGDMRFFFMETGDECSEAMEEMEVDHMQTHGIYLISRHGGGESMLVWQLQPNGGVAENPLSEVELRQLPNRAIDHSMFMMKGGVSAKSDQNEGRETEGVIMMQGYAGQIEFNLLTQKLSKA